MMDYSERQALALDGVGVRARAIPESIFEQSVEVTLGFPFHPSS